MKLSFKLIGLTLSGLIVITGMSVVLQIFREEGFSLQESRQNVENMGRVVSHLVAKAWSSGGIKAAARVIDEINRSVPSMHFKWVWFDAEKGSENAPEIGGLDRLLSEGHSFPFIAKPDKQGQMRTFSYFPVSVPEMRPGGLEVSRSLSNLKAYTRNTIKFVAIAGILSVLASWVLLAIGSFLLVTKPLRLVMQRTREIHAGRLEGALRLDHRDEMGELASAINDMSAQLLLDRDKIRQEMTARIEALEELRHADRLRSVGRLASGIAHELGTPLNVVSGRAGLIATDPAATGEIIGSAETIRGQCDRMTAIIRQLLNFARGSTPKRERSDLTEITSQTTALIKPLALKGKVHINFAGPEFPVMVMADPGQIEEVLTNLITNAVQSMPEGGQAWVEIDKTRTRPPHGHDDEEGEYWCIRVRDQGAGISPDDLPHIFDPFFTTKGMGEGTGLGLSIAYGIVQEHDGWIEASSEPGHGSTFSVYLPAEKTQ